MSGLGVIIITPPSSLCSSAPSAISAFLFLPVFSSVFPAYFSSFAAPLLFHPLEESDGRADKVELLAELVLKEPLVAKVQSAGLVGEEHKGRREIGRASCRERV